VICISVLFLQYIGMRDEEIETIRAAGNHSGLAISRSFAFSGGDADIFRSEPEPRSLVLVGMVDRYGWGTRLAKTVTTFGVSLAGVAKPTAVEARLLSSMLCHYIHPSALVIAEHLMRLVKTYSPPTVTA
jgi:hypothetical protein